MGEYMCVVACMWRAEDNFRQLVLFSHLVEAVCLLLPGGNYKPRASWPVCFLPILCPHLLYPCRSAGMADVHYHICPV